MKQFGIFAKYWQAGRVKTRLSASVGEQAASRIYRCFVRVLLSRFQQVADRNILAYSPPERREQFARLAGGSWWLVPQAEGDLGARMQGFFAEALEGGAERVVLIGSDSPNLPVELVQEAFEQLQHYSVVLGPALDGGYYLVGARGRVPPIFEQISWSSAVVWQQTVERLAAAGCAWTALPPWYDIDELDDLRRLAAQLGQSSGLEPAERELLAAVQEVLPS